MADTRNSKLLDSFVAYCIAHPEQRFWQALRNWCGWGFVLVVKVSLFPPNVPEWDVYDVHDTFYWEENKPVH